MIDLHCHLLPGIDDGPDTLDEAAEMARIAVADGITHAVVTPHIHPGRWENTRASVAAEVDQYREILAEKSIALEIGFAGEVRLTDQLMQQVDSDEIPYYGEYEGYQIMLLEFPHGHVVPGTDKLITWLIKRGIRPLLAHPERNRQLMRDPAQVQPLVDCGCLLQVTAGSIVGLFGSPAQAVATSLLEEDLVAVIASDGHNLKARKPCLQMARTVVSGLMGEARAEMLFRDTPWKIVAGQFPGNLSTNAAEH